MKNIIEILKGLNIEISEENAAAITKEVAENYKTIAEFDKKISKLETERDGLKDQLEIANNSLKGFEGVDVESLKTEVAEANKKVEEAKKDYEAKIAAREYEDALKTGMEQYKFSSKAAQRAMFHKVKEADLKCVEGNILGLDDYMKKLREEDATAFADDEDGEQPAKFTNKFGNAGSGKKYNSRDEIMKIKSAKERQAAIAENYQLFQ